MTASRRTSAIPRLPVLSWQLFEGARHAHLPCILDHAGMRLTTSGRASILLAIKMLDIRPGDRVLVPTYHCPTMVAPVVAVGAEPVFYPIDETGAPCIAWLRSASLEGVKAILAAHYFGLPQTMQTLRNWCDDARISLIEDCAHSLFGRGGAREVGKWGDIAIGSLTKFLPVPEGGCLVMNRDFPPPSLSRPSLKQQVKAAVDIVHVAADHRRLTGLSALVRSGYAAMRIFKPAEGTRTLGHVSEGPQPDAPMDGFTLDHHLSHRALTGASAWVARHAHRARIVERRRSNYLTLAERLGGLLGMRPLHTDLPEGAAPYVFPLWVESPDPGYSELRRLGIPVSRWDRLWPGIPSMPNDVGTDWSHHVLQIACHQDLSALEIETVIETLIRLFAMKANLSTAGAGEIKDTALVEQA